MFYFYASWQMRYHTLHNGNVNRSGLIDKATEWYARWKPWIWGICAIGWFLLCIGTSGRVDSVFFLLSALTSSAIIGLRVPLPGVSLILAWITAIFVMLPPGLVTGFPSVAILIALTSAAHRGSVWTKRFAAISVPSGAIIGGLYLSVYPMGSEFASAQTASRDGFLNSAVLMLLLLGFFWAIGTIGAVLDNNRDRMLQIETAQRESASQKERANLARDMHDVVAHSLSVMISLSDGTRLSSKELPQETKESLERISQVGRTSLTEVRSLLAQLRDPSSAKTESLNTVEGLVRDLHDAGTPVQLTVTGPEPDIASPQYATVTYVLREALTNALRHGRPNVPINVTIDWDNMRLTVENPIDPHGTQSSGEGWGIIGMRERAELLGGSLKSGPLGASWLVQAHLSGENESQ